MALRKKEYEKDQKHCEVTFELEREAAQGAETVFLVGDFNSWSSMASPMKKKPDGSFTITVELETGREYQFRYLIDGKRWENDWHADKYVPAPFGVSDNSVVIV